MFAPKSAKSQTKATERPTGKLPPQRSMLAARPLVGGAAEQARLTGNESRRDSERKADPARPIARGATPGASWDFSRIPIYSPERREAAGAKTSSTISRIPNDSRNSPSLKHREIQIALPPWQRADWTAGSTPKAVSMLGAGRALTAEERKVAADDVPLADVRVHDDSNAQVMTALLGTRASPPGSISFSATPRLLSVATCSSRTSLFTFFSSALLMDVRARRIPSRRRNDSRSIAGTTG
jgi:hypothetical protein